MYNNFNDQEGYTYTAFSQSNDEYRRKADELRHRKKMNTIITLTVVIILGLAVAF